jgi:hypothetical protein
VLNQAPIFLNCFSRGGSNILWNIFLTHPDVCSPMRETLEIFRTDIKHPLVSPPRLAGFKLALLSRQFGLLNQWNLNERRPIPTSAQNYFDAILYHWKLKTVEDAEMRYKTENETYALEEVQKSRLAAKNNNGLIFLSDILLEMYPDATFFALVRHPFALYESYKRRNISSSVEEFAAYYSRITQRMIRDADRLKRCYHLVRFEDLMADPLTSVKQLYRQAGLDFAKIKKIRFKDKPHFQKDGQHTSKFDGNHHYWFEPEKLYDMLEPNINELQAGRLSNQEKDSIISMARESMSRLNYL